MCACVYCMLNKTIELKRVCVCVCEREREREKARKDVGVLENLHTCMTPSSQIQVTLGVMCCRTFHDISTRLDEYREEMSIT